MVKHADLFPSVTGVLIGPDEAFAARYSQYADPETGKQVVVIATEDDAETKPILMSHLQASLAQRPYVIEEPEGGWRERDSFSADEKAKLRPIAETLAMLAGNAFLNATMHDGAEWYEMYLPEAAALYDRNGGDGGWAGLASFVQTSKEDR